MLNLIFDINQQLASIQRYSKTKLVNRESVLEHQGWVALTSYFITKRLNQFGEEFNIENVLVGATVHDLDETGTGDIQRPTKYSSPMMLSLLDSLAKESVADLASNLKIHTMLVDWEDSKSGRDGAIVSAADGLAVLYKVWQEVRLYGNITILDHAGPVESMVSKKLEYLLGKCVTPGGIDFVSDLRHEAMKIITEVKEVR